jgi:hypothetical protein
MAAAASTDFHWEVKINALDFWYAVIRKCLKCQGMIDDRFPGVTFSKTTRRIINLDNKEIKSRLLIVLDQMSENRCLAVLMTALNDPDLPVVKKAVEILEFLIKHLEEYDVLSKDRLRQVRLFWSSKNYQLGLQFFTKQK